tara:strand:- start:680 stop:928 length:249 start_codon:yes stop_codon:yes gene_type:complete
MRTKYTVNFEIEGEKKDVEKFIDNNLVSCKYTQIKNVEIKEDKQIPLEERPYIYERNSDTGEIFRRRAMDYVNRERINPKLI